MEFYGGGSPLLVWGVGGFRPAFVVLFARPHSDPTVTCGVYGGWLLCKMKKFRVFLLDVTCVLVVMMVWRFMNSKELKY